MASYSSQGVDVGPSYPLGDPEDEGGDTNQRDVHHNEMMLEFLHTGMVPSLADAKEKDCVFRRAKRHCLEGRHILQVWKDGRVLVIPHPSQRTRIVLHAHEELGNFGVKRTYSLLQG
ncbi:unnamed protein product [Calypogeia fissa]